MNTNFSLYFLFSILVGGINLFSGLTGPVNALGKIADDQDKNKIISRLIKDVKILQAHEKDYIDIFQYIITAEVKASIEKNIVGNKKIISVLEDINNNIVTEDKALRELLWLRHSLINSRRSNTLIFNKYRLDRQAHLVIFGPTAPEMYDLLTPDQQIYARKATDKYQLFNKIILGLASMTNLRTLSAQTKQLLRASPTLCTLIEDSSRPLGHPDEAFILDNTSNEMRDWEYLMSVKPCYEITVPNYSSFYKDKKEKSILLNAYDKQEHEPGWKNPYGSKELPYPQFLKPYSHAPVIPNNTTSNASSLEKTLEVKDIESESRSLSEPKQQISKKHRKLKKREEPQDVQASERTEIVSEPVQSTPINASTEPPLAALEVRENTSQGSEKKQDLLITNTTIIDEIVNLESNLPISDKTTEDVAEILYRLARPKGMRLFHNKQSSSQHNQVIVSGHHTKTLEKLFSPQKFSHVRYADFATLWRHINGQSSIKESTGSSHKALLDQAGNVVTGIYAHNENERFGKRAIKYVRDAFKQIGYNHDEM